MIETRTLLDMPRHYATNFKECRRASYDNMFTNVYDFGPTWFFVCDFDNSCMKPFLKEYMLRIIND